MRITLSIPGKPIAKARPRFAKRGKFTVAYSPQQTEEGLWIMEARRQLEGVCMFERALYLEVIFWMPRPKSHFGKKGLKATAPKKPTGKPDLSNLVKFVEDCLNECFVWPDDSFITEILAEKCYCEGELWLPSTEIIVSDEE